MSMTAPDWFISFLWVAMALAIFMLLVVVVGFCFFSVRFWIEQNKTQRRIAETEQRIRAGVRRAG